MIHKSTLLFFIFALSSIALAESEVPNPAQEKRELLAHHDTVARLKGIEYRTCMGRTSLCPERCGDSGEYAEFEVLAYLRYEKPGQYGDAKQTVYRIQISDFHRKPKGDAKILETVSALKPGDTVRLEWRHDYVTRNGSSFPERPIMRLEKLDEAEANRLMESP